MPKLLELLRSQNARRWRWAARHAARLLATSPMSSESRRELVRVSDTMGFTERKPKLSKKPVSDAVTAAGAGAGSGQDVSATFRTTLPSIDSWAVSPYELAAISALCAARAPRQAFEFGTYTGRTTLNLALNMPAGAVLRTIDLPPGMITMPNGASPGQDLDRHADLLTDVSVERLLGDCRTMMFDDLAGTQEMVFIDAGHGYHSVKADTASALRMTQSVAGAVIVWHDYRTFEGVTQAVDELLTDGPTHAFFAMLAGTSMACMVRR